MFERYTEKARRVIFFARYEASEFGSVCIETEHILLGLLREDKALFFRLLPKLTYQDIHKEVTAHTVVKEKVATSVDLPLSDESKRVLAFSAEEAESLNHRHIGTEHLLLGLLREKKHPAAQLLQQHGAELAKLRLAVEKLPSPWPVPSTYSALARRAQPVIRDTVEIHGTPRDFDSVRDAVSNCRAYSWHWQKKPWAARDMVVERARGSLSFDLSLAADTANYELIKAGWKKDHCSICRWELFESKEDAAHGTGYTNGRDWLCTECYEKFLDHPDFFSSPYRDIT